MSVKHCLLIAVLATACRDKAPAKSAALRAEAAAATVASSAVDPVRIAQAAPAAPKLPPPPPEQRAQIMVSAPPAAHVVPSCDRVKLRVYADGVRRSCMTASEEKPGKQSRTMISCGMNAELPADKAVHVELRYEQRGVEVARLDLGELTLDVGQQSLTARGKVTYGDVDRVCVKR